VELRESVSSFKCSDAQHLRLADANCRLHPNMRAPAKSIQIFQSGRESFTADSLLALTSRLHRLNDDAAAARAGASARVKATLGRKVKVARS
jgi:hypothetical protein